MSEHCGTPLLLWLCRVWLIAKGEFGQLTARPKLLANELPQRAACVEQPRVRHGVHHGPLHSRSPQQALVTHYRQVLGDIGPAHAEPFGEFTGTHWPAAQEIKDLQASRMRKDFADLGMELVDSLVRLPMIRHHTGLTTQTATGLDYL